MTIVCATGHRPEDSEDESIVRLKTRVKIQHSRFDTFITGMAAGFDLWAGDEALRAGKEIWCAVPWRGHKPRKGDEEVYQRLIESATKVHYVTEVDNYPGAWVYPKRNHWMVDNADRVLMYWSGKESGGTYECRNYAKKMGKPIANIYDDPPF